MARTKKRRSTYHHGDLERALIEATLALLQKRGPTGWTLREVARRAGVSAAAPYRHFENKNALLAAVAEQGFVALEASLMAVRATCAPSPLAQLAELGTAHVRFAVAHPSHYRVMFGPETLEKSSYPSLHAAAQRAFFCLRDVMVECRAAGLVRDDDPLVLSLAALSTMHGLADLVLTGQLVGTGWPRELYAELPARIGQLLYEGLAPRG